MHKSRLQELCQQRQWALPRYTSMKDGPDHNPSFKSSVFLNGMSFHSSVSCKSCKEAQNDAAKSAFLHFSSSSFSSYPAMATQNPVQEFDLGFYKNLLQELTQREDLTQPEYKTNKFGMPHRPRFLSSVEVEGELFHGKEAKSKKEAEFKAAKVAYTKLNQRKSPLSFTVMANSTIISDNSVSCSEFLPVSSKEGLKGESSELYSLDSAKSSSDSAIVAENEDEVQEIKPEGEELAINATISPSYCSKAAPISLNEGSSSSSTSTELDISGLSISGMEKEPELKSYLLNNRFRVYSSFPHIAFPEGITVLPISEDKWVTVSLEFPNEKDA